MLTFGGGITYVNGSGSFVPIKIDLRYYVSGQQVEIVSFLGDRAVIAIRSGRTRLVDGFHRDRTVEEAICIAGVGLRLRGQADALPTVEEIVRVRLSASTDISFDETTLRRYEC